MVKRHWPQGMGPVEVVPRASIMWLRLLLPCWRPWGRLADLPPLALALALVRRRWQLVVV